ncbi:MAG: radical SAM protein [archaeon]
MAIKLQLLKNALDSSKNYLQKKPVVMSFEVTNKCNLKCEMCYWWKHRIEKELSVDEIVNLFKILRKKYKIFHCTYGGGEPTLRPDVLTKCTKIMPENWIITNGTIDMPKLNNKSTIGVSIDGTEKIHNKVRGKNIYNQIKERYKDYTKYPVYTATTLVQSNKNEIEEIVKEWSKTSIKGMFFDFATPFKNSNNEFFISLNERDKIIDRIIKLKKEYGNFITFPEKGYNYLRKEFITKRSKDCILKWFALCLDSQGKRKMPCGLGKDIICNKCGCITAAFVQYYFKPRIESPLIISNLIHKSLSNKN